MLAFAHFIVPPFLLKVFDRAKKISPKMLFFAAMGGLLPDLDYFYIWLINPFLSEPLIHHRTLFHNIFFVLFLLVLVLVLYSQDNKFSKYILFFTFGVSVHIFLDMIDIALPLFYPFVLDRFGFYLFDFKNRLTILIRLDAILFTIWVVYISVSGKLKSIL